MSKFICIWSPQVKKLKLLLVWGRNKGIEKEVKHKYLAAFIMVHVSLVAQMVKKKKKVCLQCRRPGFNPWVGKIPWRRKWQPTPVFLSGKSHGQRSLAGYSPWGHKELDTTE